MRSDGIIALIRFYNQCVHALEMVPLEERASDTMSPVLARLMLPNVKIICARMPPSTPARAEWESILARLQRIRRKQEVALHFDIAYACCRAAYATWQKLHAPQLRDHLAEEHLTRFIDPDELIKHPPELLYSGPLFPDRKPKGRFRLVDPIAKLALRKKPERADPRNPPRADLSSNE